MDYFGTGYFEPGYFDPGYFGAGSPTPTPTPTATGGASPSIALILRRMAATRAAAQGALRQTGDRAFISGMIHVVTLYYDAAAGRGPRGGTKLDWQPVGGFEAIPCRVVLRRPEPTEGAGKPGDLVMGRVLFGQQVPAGRGNKLVWESPDGPVMNLYLVGPVIDAHGMGHHWYADVQDMTL
jgi:hypothetical protein